MKLLCFSDLHLTNKNPKFKYGEGGVSDLLSDQERFVEFIVDKYLEDQYDFLLFLGDWTDYPTLDPILQTKSNELLKMVSQAENILIEGNHCISDIEGKFTVLGATDSFMSDLGSTVVTGNKVIKFDGEISFYCFPYRSDFKAIEAAVAEANSSLDANVINVMLFHFPTTNAVLDNQLQSKKGVALTEDIISNFDVVIGGDFHRPQQLIGTSRAYYVGAPFDFNYGDHVESRGALSVEVTKEALAVDWIENPFRRLVKKVSIEEAFKLTKEELSRNIYRVVGETSDPKITLELQAIQKDSYKFDIGVRRPVAFELEDSVKVIESVDSSTERDLLHNYLMGYEGRDRVLDLFDKIKMTCQ